MKLYHIEYGVLTKSHVSSNKEEILQMAINYIIPILEKKLKDTDIDEAYLKCYIEIQNNNLEKAIKIYSTFVHYPYNLTYSVIEPKSLSNEAIELLDKKVKEMVFK